MAIAALLTAIILSLVSVLVTILLHSRAMNRADTANEIATEALNIEKARIDSEQEVFVQPVRFDPNGGHVFYQVLSHRPVEEVVFEFRNYAGNGGRCQRYKVAAGEQRLAIGEFDQSSDLETPGAREFYARANWKQADADGHQTSGLYLASKSNYSFVRRNRT